MTIIKVLILASIGGIIGWVTNHLAIKLMFRPFNEVKVPILNLTFQGLIPKRKGEIANTIATTIETELFSTTELLENMLTEDNQKQILHFLKVKLTSVVKEKLPPMLAMFSPAVTSMVDSVLEKEGPSILREIMFQGGEMLTEQVQVSSLVEEKINSFDLEKLEGIILSIARKELKHIEFLGGVLGFIIGLVQGGIIILIG
ncbi:DUF445 family protein [Alkalicella caledoniensis]|uniref:DUF445 family protein n=1 Tax=Alkalicella caledoniensis TaxID=2731377 RepID=A0A7G9WAC6_ALKCA|nr:DUF445 family protein [Alkalicella caledoniensis]QNO15638.1 DUF445 family protein [Alkalicella caledoniensis]